MRRWKSGLLRLLPAVLLMIQMLFLMPQISMSAAAAQGDDCNIDSDGYCIFTGTPHQTGLQPVTINVVDGQGNFLFLINQSVAANSAGEILQASGRPAFDGDDLIEHSQENLSEDEKAFHKVMAVMYPIRNALMYNIADLTQNQWDVLVTELEIRDIKETTYTGGPTPKDNYYGRQGVFNLARNPDGEDITNEIIKFLEEASIHLLCHVTSDEFNQVLHDNHPEGHDPCSDAEISTKIPFDLDADDTSLVEDSENSTVQGPSTSSDSKMTYGVITVIICLLVVLVSVAGTMFWRRRGEA